MTAPRAMLFPTPEFLFAFLPLVLALYLAAAGARRLAGWQSQLLPNGVLLVASLYFYAWGEGPLVGLMLASIAGNYLLGLWIGALRGSGGGRLQVGLAVAFNLGLLGYFKYANFGVENFNRLLAQLGGEPSPWTQVVVPIGISFFTFQALSYVIDVFRGDAAVQKNPVQFALYVALFPQLIAGPIVRYRDVADQLLRRRIDAPLFSSGVQRFAIGLGKKVLIANPVGEVAAACLGMPTAELTPGLAWIGIIAYTLQIYFDFSGYSDMAIGLGRLFGFRFLENFRWPYVARSITEFWRRWHISLSTWFRDYLYIPLGGNRRGRPRTLVHLGLVFFLCGLWHGAAWNFVVWGLYHGAFLVIERAGLGLRLERTPSILRHVYVLAVVMVGWVFFAAPDLAAALGYLGAMLGLSAGNPLLHPVSLVVKHGAWLAMAAGVAGSVDWAPALGRLRDRWAVSRPGGALALDWLGAGLLMLVLAASAAWVTGTTFNPFIYFRF